MLSAKISPLFTVKIGYILAFRTYNLLILLLFSSRFCFLPIFLDKIGGVVYTVYDTCDDF